MKTKVASRAAAAMVLAFSPMICGRLIADELSKPNIVFILSDDLGFGDVSCYGATRIQTPNIDRLAAEGIRFTDAHSTSSTCTPSRYALLTGEYPWRKKGTGVLPGDAALIIEPGRPTLASILHDAGYRTGVIGKWHLGLGNGHLDWNGDIKPGPLELGFDYCFLMPATGDRVPSVYVENHRVVGLDPKDPLKVSFAEYIGDEPTGKDHPELLKVKTDLSHSGTIVNGISRIGFMSGGKSARWSDEDMAATYVKKAADFIEEHKKEPFFLYFCTHDIHVPHVPGARFAGKSSLGVRGDAILQFDWCVGELLAVLKKNGLAGNTLVILSSDNGPIVEDSYIDGSREKLGDHKPAGPWRGSKYSIYEGGTRLPFIVRWPGRVKPGISDALVSQVDFPATFAALVGQKFDAATAPDSRNMLPALLGDSPQGREQLVEHSGILAAREGAWKFIDKSLRQTGSKKFGVEPGLEPEVQLYNLADDPHETQNVAAGNPDKLVELQTLLDREKSKGMPSEAPKAK